MDDYESRPRLTHNDYTIGWVCALPNEQAAAIFMLDHKHQDLPNPVGDRNTYMLGRIGKHNVVIAGLPLGRVGNNTAVTVATRMVSSFPNIRVGLMVGVGGGIPHKTRLGDVVISCPSGTEPGVVQWDMGKTEAGQFVRTGSLAPPPTALLTGLTRFKADYITMRKNMLKYLRRLETNPDIPNSYSKSDSLQDLLFHPSYNHIEGDDGDEDNCRLCDKTKLVRRSKRESPMIYCGLIASGNQVIKDANFRDSLSKNFNNDILCIEMEAAGLLNDFPCVVIRGIADYSDSHKNEKWQDYAAATASACAKALLMVVATSEVDKLQRVQLTISPGLIQSAMHYWPFWKNEKKDTADPRVTAFEDSNLETDPRRSPFEMAQLDDTSRNAKSGETTPEEEKPPKMAAIEAPKRASSYDTSPTHQTLESWLQGPPPFLAAKFRQGSIDDAMRDILMGLGQSPVPREDENRTEMISPERRQNAIQILFHLSKLPQISRRSIDSVSMSRAKRTMMAMLYQSPKDHRDRSNIVLELHHLSGESKKVLFPSRIAGNLTMRQPLQACTYQRNAQTADTTPMEGL
ncbi:nucleoside phosphorylase domain-containing protein [Trichoderma camerunense]